MTDAELIARLRSADLYNAQHYERDPLHKQAADRIEALLNLNEALVELIDDRNSKLTKAADMMRSMAAMIQHAIGPGKDVFIEPDTRRKLSDAYAVIAEIEGT
jgi:hypothetical protein